MELITGRTGTQHVYAEDDAEIYRQLFGSDDYVLPTGSQLSAQLNGPTEIQISDGSLITQGRLAKIRASDGYDSLSIPIGIVGYKRLDFVVAEYTSSVVEGEETSSRIESITLKLIQGTNSQDSYIEPELTTGDIDKRQTHQVLLWGVKLDGINVKELVDYRSLMSEDVYSQVVEKISATGQEFISTLTETSENTLSEMNTILAETTSKVQSVKQIYVAEKTSGEYPLYTSQTYGATWRKEDFGIEDTNIDFEEQFIVLNVMFKLNVVTVGPNLLKTDRKVHFNIPQPYSKDSDTGELLCTMYPPDEYSESYIKTIAYVPSKEGSTIEKYTITVRMAIMRI